MKYKDLLLLAKEKIDEAMAPLRAREMRKKGELEVIKLEAEIAEHESKMQKMKSTYPLNYESILDHIDELNLLQRRKDKFEEIIAELFADEVK